MILEIFKTFLYQPLFNILIVFYKIIPGADFGIAVIALTLLIRILLYPLAVKSIKSQKTFAKIQPLIKEIQEKYKNDKEKQAAEIMAVYKQEKFNPFSGFLSLLIQVPVLIALYWVFMQGFDPSQMKNLYSFISAPGNINTLFLGLINMDKPSVLFAFLAGIAQFWQAKSLVAKSNSASLKKEKKSDMAQIMEKQTLYVMPVFTGLILFNLPAAIGLYWTVSTLFMIGQQYFLANKTNQ